MAKKNKIKNSVHADCPKHPGHLEIACLMCKLEEKSEVVTKKRCFDLNHVEVENLEKFEKTIPKEYKRKKNLKIIFSLGGIGIGITAKRGKYKTNITDYFRW